MEWCLFCQLRSNSDDTTNESPTNESNTVTTLHDIYFCQKEKLSNPYSI